jgi:hypothetical protein
MRNGVVVGIPERMTAADRQHSDPSIHGVGRHDTEDVAVAPDGEQHIAGRALLRAEHPHPTARLANG